MENRNRNVVVLYHAECMDGFGAAFATWCKFGNEATYIPVRYGDDAPDVTGKDVYLVDFSFKRPVLLSMAATVRHLTIYDHHKTAEVDLEGTGSLPNITTVFDMNRSGAVITWEELFPTFAVPEMLLYIQDRDLWQWEMDDSEEISAALMSYPKEFDLWRDLKAQWHTISNKVGGAKDRLIYEGGTILRAQKQLIDQIAGQAEYLPFFAYSAVPVVNTPVFQSEVCNILAKGIPYAAAFYVNGEGKYVYSLRSEKGVGVNVSEIAKQYGGGGHFHAAGFVANERVL